MNVAIVDDSLIDRQHLYHGLERYCREHKVHMKIEQFDNGTDFLNTFNANVYNLVFLDIFLNEIDGMQVAKSIFDQDPQLSLIHILASLYICPSSPVRYFFTNLSASSFTNVSQAST